MTTVIPYTAVIPLEGSGALGRTNCDLAGQPYIQINLNVPPEYRVWILVHERAHVAQIRAFAGTCFDYMARYRDDTPFRLKQEAEAFCAVYTEQKKLGDEERAKKAA